MSKQLKEQAAAELEKLPGDTRLVDDALFLLFRGFFPKDVILQKYTRNYYETLKKMTLWQWKYYSEEVLIRITRLLMELHL
jgi:hypothetical protein